MDGSILDLVALVVAGAIGIATKYIVGLLKDKGIITKINGHKEIVKIAVNAVEQIYKDLHGKDKFNLVKDEVLKLAKEKGLKISEKELDLLIEAVVKEMNETIKDELK